MFVDLFSSQKVIHLTFPVNSCFSFQYPSLKLKSKSPWKTGPNCHPKKERLIFPGAPVWREVAHHLRADFLRTRYIWSWEIGESEVGELWWLPTKISKTDIWSGAYENHWFPLTRPAIKPLFLEGGRFTFLWVWTKYGLMKISSWRPGVSYLTGYDFIYLRRSFDRLRRPKPVKRQRRVAHGQKGTLLAVTLHDSSATKHQWLSLDVCLSGVWYQDVKGCHNPITHIQNAAEKGRKGLFQLRFGWMKCWTSQKGEILVLR